MTTVTSAVRAALKAQPYRLQWAVRIQFPGYDFKAWDGIGPKSISGQTYQGVGSLGAIAPIPDTSVDGVRGPVSERMELKLTGLESTLATELRDFQHQGSAVTITAVLLDATETIVADPLTVFTGQVDTMTYVLGETLEITVTAENFLSYMFRGPDGRRRGDSDQQEIFSGDVCFQFQGKLTPNIPWGVPTNKESVPRGGGAGGAADRFRWIVGG